MTSQLVEIAVSDLLLDPANARLSKEESGQQETALALAAQQGRRIVELAADVVKHRLDPTTLPAVVATGDRRKRYRVLEGNRRVLALKALETPTLIHGALSATLQTRLHRLAEEYAKDAVDNLTCVLFDDEDEARHWIQLRHTGQNDGVGLVEWDTDQKDRFIARHGNRSAEGQVLDFVDKHGLLSEAAKLSPTRVITTVKRLISTPEVREILGIDVIGGTVYSNYPLEEVAKSLGHVVEELKSGAINVGSVYTADERRQYADAIPRSARPKKKSKLPAPIPLHDLAAGVPPIAAAAPAPNRSRRRPVRVRTALIPQTCQLDIAAPRINSMYNELLSLNIDQYPNAGAVSLRVFLELSVDAYITAERLMTEQVLRNSKLSIKMKAVAADLLAEGKISSQIELAVKRSADGSKLLDASATTLNQYVHNAHVIPKPSEIRAGWDELQPFLQAIWPT